MTRKALFLMVVVLAAATAATAATALASGKHRRSQVHEQVSEAIQTNSLAMLRLRIRAFQLSQTGKRAPGSVVIGLRQ